MKGPEAARNYIPPASELTTDEEILPEGQIESTPEISTEGELNEIPPVSKTPLDDMFWPKGQAYSTSEIPAKGETNEVPPVSKTPLDDMFWPKDSVDSVPEIPTEGEVKEIPPVSKTPLDDMLWPKGQADSTPENNIETEHSITEPLDHRTVVEVEERQELVVKQTSQDLRDPSLLGDNIENISKHREAQIQETENPPPSENLEDDKVKEPEPVVVDWRPSREPASRERLTSLASESSAEIDLTATAREIAARPERIRSLGSVLSSKGLEFLKNMPENARGIASQMYEGIYAIPGVNRVVAKAETAWNQMWIDRKQDRVIELNDKVRGIAAETAVLGESESALNEALETIRSAGIGSTAKIEKSLRQINSRKIQLGEDKIKFEGKASRKQESMTSFVEKRNEITDRMVGKYAERMKPLEAKMENLKGLQDAMDFQTAIMEADHADKMMEIGKLDEKRTKVYDALRAAGQLDKNGNHPALRQFDEVINASKMKIAQAEAIVKAKKQNIQARINKTESKTNVYKGKQREFSAIKERKLYSSETPSPDTSSTESELENTSISNEFAEDENFAESSRLPIGTFLDKWNEHLKETVGDEKRKTALTIDKATFLKGARWNEGRELDFEHFVKVVEGFYRMRKIDFSDKARMAEKFKSAKIETE